VKTLESAGRGRRVSERLFTKIYTEFDASAGEKRRETQNDEKNDDQETKHVRGDGDSGNNGIDGNLLELGLVQRFTWKKNKKERGIA
jgi:hypothetical protein